MTRRSQHRVAARPRRLRNVALALPILIAAWALGSASGPAQAADELGGPFTLVDQDGRTVTDAQFRGRWMLIYFGYTHCPDACPTALTDIDAALSGMDPEKRAKVQPIFITVDPARDTPTVMKDYVGAFEGANIVGLTGTQAQVSAVEAEYRVYAKRHEEKDGDYAMSHTSAIHVMDPDGHFVAIVPPERLGERLAQLLH